MTTLAERLEDKGFQQGISKGRTEGKDEMAQDIARSLLMQENASVNNVAQITKLPISVVSKLQKDIHEKH